MILLHILVYKCIGDCTSKLKLLCLCCVLSWWKVRSWDFIDRTGLKHLNFLGSSHSDVPELELHLFSLLLTRRQKGAPSWISSFSYFDLRWGPSLLKLWLRTHSHTHIHTHTESEAWVEFSLLITLICAGATRRRVVMCMYGCEHVLLVKHRAKVKKRQFCLEMCANWRVCVCVCVCWGGLCPCVSVIAVSGVSTSAWVWRPEWIKSLETHSSELCTHTPSVLLQDWGDLISHLFSSVPASQ